MKSKDFQLRNVRGADGAIFEKVADDIFDGPVQPARLAAYLADPAHVMVLAIADGTVIGQIAGVVHRHPDLADEMYVDNLGVAPGWQRQRVATRLIDALAQVARARGCETMWVATEPDNVAANALYGSRTRAEPIAYYCWAL